MQYTARRAVRAPHQPGAAQSARAVDPRTPLHDFSPLVSSCATGHDEPLLARVYEPLFSALASRFARLRLLQQGNSHLYLAYIMVAVVAALAWASLRGGSPR